MPVTVKDNILVAGLPCRWGSRLYADYVPQQDELPVARLRAEGAVIVGKTNVPEFTLEGYTSNLLFGTTRNPWNPQLTPGGSSGGAVAALAAGLGPLALGTDGGGSIRRPVSHTGLAGLKIDFMERNDQDMVNWYHTVVEMAARHHLMIDFHGAYLPAGMQVTWPNLLTQEGVLGNEWNKMGRRDTPTNKVTLAYTRLLAGSMDYTPGGFINRSPAEWKQTKPTEVMGSRAQELALFVVYYSPLTCLSDDPIHYDGQPGLEFLREVPTVWDETRFLQGDPVRDVVLARRSGSRWFLGAITADSASARNVSLAFLGKGRYRAHIFADPADPNASYESLSVSTREVTAQDTLDLTLRPAGGAAVYFEPLR